MSIVNQSQSNQSVQQHLRALFCYLHLRTCLDEGRVTMGNLENNSPLIPPLHGKYQRQDHPP